MTLTQLQKQFHEIVGLDQVSRNRFFDALKKSDPQLFEQLEAILKNVETADRYFEGNDCFKSTFRGAITQFLLDQEVDIPQYVGSYNIMELLGMGGMGVVYHGKQKPPIERSVAIKVMHKRPGMSAEKVRNGLNREILTLAKLQHPLLPKVYEAGMTENGEPFFVMEYIAGESLTHFCDDLRFSIKERIQTLIDICEIVSWCHARGVIHGDLKPSNILLCHNEKDPKRPIPRIIDFGIARALESAIDGSHLDIYHEKPIGSLSYMAPEQAEGKAIADVRNDVYSLGAIFYELLIGEPPLIFDSISSPLTAVRSGRRLEPESKWDKMDRDKQAIAHARCILPKHLKRLLNEELNALAEKAVNVDMSRRYQTVEAFSGDLKAYLLERRLSAKDHYSTGLKLRKAWRRDRSGFLIRMSATLLGLVLVLAVMLSTFQIRTAENKTARALADARLMEQFYEKVISFPHPNSEGADVKLVDALALGESFWREYAPNRPDLEARIHVIFGATCLELGDRQRALHHFERHHALVQEIYGADSVPMALALAHLGRLFRETDTNDAIDLLERSLKLASGHVDENDLLLCDIKTSLAASYLKKERFGDAVSLAREVSNLLAQHYAEDHLELLQARMIQGASLIGLGELNEAIIILKRTIYQMETHHSLNHNDRFTAIQYLATAYLYDLEYEKAERLALEAALARKELSPDHPGVQQLRYVQARALRGQGYYKEASELMEDIIFRQMRILGPHASDTLASKDFAASLYGRMGDYEEALDGYTSLVEYYRSGGRLHEPSPLRAMNNQAHFLKEAGYYEDALSVLFETLQLKSIRYASGSTTVLNTWLTIGEAYEKQGRVSEANAVYYDVLSLFRKNHQSQYRRSLVYQWYWAQSLVRLGRYDEAECPLMEIYEVLGKGTAYGELAWKSLLDCYYFLGKPEKARILQGGFQSK